jgi:hypothetical protein
MVDDRGLYDYIEISWITDLRKILGNPDEYSLGLIVAFINDRMDDSYKQGLEDGNIDKGRGIENGRN